MDPDLATGVSDGDPVSLTVTAARLQDVVDTFAKLNVKFDKTATDLEGTVTAYVVDVPMRKLLRLILASNGYKGEEHDGIVTIRPLPGIDRYSASATRMSRRCQSGACDDIADVSLRGTLTTQKEGPKTVALFEFSKDRYRVSKPGESLGATAKVINTAPGKVIVNDLHNGVETPITFAIESISSR